MIGDHSFLPDSANSVYLIFLLISIIGYFTIPTVASWIVQSAGTGGYNKKVTGVFGGATNVAAGAAGAAGADAPGILSSYMENTDDVDRTLWCDSAFASREVPFAANGTTAAGASATATPRLAASDAESDPYMRMAGQAVFKFATSAMMRCTEEALTRAGLTTDDVTLFTPHQANERIIRYAAKKMDLPMERFQVIIDHVGNVSGASALIALNEALCEGKLQPGDIACMTAFGGGLTAGSCVIRI